MKKRDAILAVLAVILVLSASIGAASAYFTSYAEARAGYVVHMGYETVIDEDVEGNVKTVRITNQAGQGTAAGTYPVFVRVKVYNILAEIVAKVAPCTINQTEFATFL